MSANERQIDVDRLKQLFVDVWHRTNAEVSGVFYSLIDGQTYFTDHVLDERPLAASSDGLTHLSWELDVQSAVGDGFGTNFIVANATQNSATPEPGAMCLLGIGLLGLLQRSRIGRTGKEPS